jgi:uncharacterized protein YcfL
MQSFKQQGHYKLENGGDMKNLLILIAAGFLLSSCAAQQYVKVSDSASQTFQIKKIQDDRKGFAATELSPENQKLLEDKLQETLQFCQFRLSGYETKSENQAKVAYVLSMSGLIAGAVVSPALLAAAASSNAAWAAGFSGWAGATNFAGESLRTSGLSGTTVAETRNTIVRNVKDQIAIAMDGNKTFEERRNAIMQARANCILYEIAVPTISNSPAPNAAPKTPEPPASPDPPAQK